MIRLATADDLPFIFHSWVRSYSTSGTAMISTPHNEDFARRCEVCGEWSVRKGADLSGEYRHGQRELVRMLVETSTVMALQAEDVNLLDGFACYAPGPGAGKVFRDGWQPAWVVHYVYVRLSARVRGVAKSLLAPVLDDPGLVSYTHRSMMLESRRLPKNWRFDPFETYRHLERSWR